jgi:8-oxo-dGTP pyrophosphatase MutT (NUDIX family)
MPHINEKIDFTASAYIVCDNKVLLRFHEKHHRWLIPGGHIELGDDPMETVIKEAKEETGLDIRIVADPVMQYPSLDKGDDGVDLPLPIFINRHRVNEGHEHIDLMYAAETDTMDINPGEGELSDPKSFRWVTAEELENLEDVSVRVKHHALMALEKVKNSKL